MHMPGFKNPKLKAVAAAIAFAVVSAASTNANALIVYDPAAVAQAVKQVAQGVQEIEHLKNQVQAQMSMLKAIGTNYASALPSMNGELASILSSASGIGYSAMDVDTLLSSVFPDAPTIAGLSPGDLTSALSAWHNATDQSLRTALQTQQRIAQQQPLMQSAVTSALGASQSAYGQTSAIQATNQLLATVSTQLTQLQAILTTQARAVELAQQQQQADSAAALTTSEQATNTLNGTPPPSPEAITDTSSL
jgi:P-type conjugative transfer protein TrbJ